MFYFQKVRFQSSDIEAQYDVFRRLGLSCEMVGNSLKVYCGRTEIVFELSDNKPIYHYCLLVSEEGLESTLVKLKAYGFKIIPDGDDIIIHTKSWNSDSIYFYDADGNIAEVIYHRHFQIENSIEDQTFIQLAEIGVVDTETDSVKQNIELILGESPYASTSNRFYDIGSPGAMFIVIDPLQKDTWFPSKIVPKIAPCSGVIHKDDLLYEFNVQDIGQVPTLSIVRLE